ncbi:transglycosylase SLT domain-containing protein [Nocardia sp. NPDC127579]|uniref:transglycosylase SLT domain-containing protein n=1 Tax=Nocardia sp. NPDC127579 TaxID=3345402 RepID=UPI00362EB9E4
MSTARPDALAGPGGTSPLAVAALGSLASIAAHYGSGAPNPVPGQSDSAPIVTGRPTGPLALDGALSSEYSTSNNNTSHRANALHGLNTELARILDGAIDTTTRGRAAIDTIIADVNTALTALGPVENTAAGQQLLINTLGTALHRAGSVLGQGQAAAAVSGERVAALAAKYLHESRPPRRRRTRLPAAARRGAGSGPPRSRPAGQQGQWIDEAMEVLRRNGYDTSRIDPADIAAIIQHESSGNPNAINLWDSNAAKGIPSKGLMQTIDPTFNAYSLPGHRDIWNPVDNIVAGVRYAIDRYGSVDNVPGLVQMRQGGAYQGY